MADLVVVTDRYAAQLDVLARRPALALLRLWDDLGSWDEADGLRFVEAARGLLQGSAEAAVQLTAAYADQLGQPPRSASPLVAENAAARAWDPFDRLAHLLASGTSWDDAIASARTVARQVGAGSVYQSSREAIAELIVGERWQRRLDSAPCDWCIEKSYIVFDSAADATFGHPDCGCLPVPVDALGERTLRIQETSGVGPKGRYDPTRKLRRSQRAAERRRDNALAELATEVDPARRERLTVRAADWDTRARRAAERIAQAA